MWIENWLEHIRRKKGENLTARVSGLLKNTNSTQELKLLGKILRYDLYYSLTYFLMWKLFKLETCINQYYIVLNFYQINKDGEIQTRDRLVIKALIPCQIINSTQKFKLLGEASRYDLYYFLTN